MGTGIDPVEQYWQDQRRRVEAFHDLLIEVWAYADARDVEKGWSRQRRMAIFVRPGEASFADLHYWFVSDWDPVAQMARRHGVILVWRCIEPVEAIREEEE